jgi:hypothetical protein
MPDTLEMLRNVVEDGLGTPPSVEEVQRRAHRDRVRRRVPALVLVTVSILAVASVAIAHAFTPPASRGRHTAAPPPTIARSRRLLIRVDTAATPPGWTPVAWNGAQISVPSSWIVQEGPPGYEKALQTPVCALPSDTVGLGVPVTPGLESCRSNARKSWAALVPMPARHPRGRAMTINGIPVSARARTPRTYYAPSLGVAVVVNGPLASQVIRTLTNSPRAVVLQPGPVAPISTAGWERVSFRGLSLRVPTSDGSPMFSQLSPRPGCIPLLSLNDQVLFSSDVRISGPLFCPYVPPTASLTFGSGTGIEVNARPARAARYTGLARGAPGPCTRMHGLRLCPYPYPAADVLSVLVSGPSLSHRLLVSIGLGGDGLTARAILESMRPS